MTRTEKVLAAAIILGAIGAFVLSSMAVREVEQCGPALVAEKVGDREVVSLGCKYEVRK